VKALIDKGADPNIVGLNNGRTALINAAKLGLSDIVEALIAGGADVSTRDNAGKTALSEASRQLRESSGYIGYKVIIQLLKQAGARE
jgi:ankyrin repeat protein